MSGNSKTLIADFTEGSVGKKLVTFAMPLFLSNLLQIVYNMVDMVIVGHVMGSVGISAVAVGGDVCNFLTMLAMGFSNAGQVIISQYIGAGEKQKLGRFVGTMCTFLLSFALCLSAIALFVRTPVLQLMNTPEESFGEALNYSTVCMCGMVFIYGYNMVSAILRGMGDSKRPFVFISISAVMNVVLDLVFVMGLDMGAMGAALATVISQAVSFLCCVGFIFKKREAYQLDVSVRDFFSIDGAMLLDLVRLGIPMAIKSAAISFSKLFVNSWINSYGVTVSAFAGIANKISNTTNLISNAFSTAGSSMVGQNIGARKHDRVRKIIFAVYRVTLSAAAVMSVLILLFPEQIYGIFTTEAPVIAIGMEYIPVAILLFFGSAARSGMNALINGSGNYKINFATALLDGVILRIGFAVLFGLVLDMRYIGFWLGDALAGYTPCLIGTVFYFSGRWKKK